MLLILRKAYCPGLNWIRIGHFILRISDDWNKMACMDPNSRRRAMISHQYLGAAS
jgi:hypothetical protein